LPYACGNIHSNTGRPYFYIHKHGYTYIYGIQYEYNTCRFNGNIHSYGNF